MPKRSVSAPEPERDLTKTYTDIPPVPEFRSFFVARWINKYNIEMGLYMLEPWERYLLNTFAFAFFIFAIYNMMGVVDVVRGWTATAIV